MLDRGVSRQGGWRSQTTSYEKIGANGCDVSYDWLAELRLFVRTRGAMVLAKVGVFTVPMHLNGVGVFQASMPVLIWLKVTKVLLDAWDTASAIILVTRRTRRLTM